MKLLRSSFVFCAIVCGMWTAFATDIAASRSPQNLVKDVIYNELQDRQRGTFWQYHIEKRVGADTFSALQIETNQGPISRILTRNGKPMSAAEKQQEADRLSKLMDDPAEQARVKQKHEDDEARLERLMKLMPEGFVFEYDGMDGGFQRLKFQPNPAFNPPTFEARIFHAMAGALWIDPQQKRLARLQGSILERVDFGYGLLGHVDKGGTFELKRQQVSDVHWKTSLVDVRVNGRVILFKTIAKDQTEVRSGFKSVQTGTSLRQALKMLDEVGDAS
jgi:hypothetical protein